MFTFLLCVSKVNQAILVIRSALANSMKWEDIDAMVEEAKARDDPVATLIDEVQYKSNEMTLYLRCACFGAGMFNVIVG